MEELLIIAIQFLFELVLNILSNLPLDWPSRKRDKPEQQNSYIYSFLWLGCGCILAGLSLLIVKHSLISIPALRIANLVFSPIISAFFYQSIARHRARENRFIIPRNHFWQAFWLTLGFSLIRFAYASRN